MPRRKGKITSFHRRARMRSDTVLALHDRLVYLKEEDGLMHFYYKDLGSNDTEVS